MIYCQNVNCQRTGKELPKNRKNKNKNNKKEKIDKNKKEKKIETKNASLKLDRLRHNNSFL